MKFCLDRSVKRNRNAVIRSRLLEFPGYRLVIGVFIVGLTSSLLFAQAPAISVDSVSSEVVRQNRNIELSTQLDPEGALRVGSVVTFEVIVRWLDLGERLSTRLVEAPSVENFKMLSSSTRSVARVTDEGRRMEEIYVFRLMPEEEGAARVGAVEVVYGADGEEEGRLSSVAHDVSIAPPEKSNTLPLIIGAGVVLIVVVVGVIVIFIRRGSRVEEPVITERETEGAKDDALTEAKRWRMEGDISRYYGCLERVVAEELAKRYSYPGGKLKSARDLPEEVDSETKRLVESFFLRCAEAKYAPGAPSREELDRIFDDANRLISRSF